MDTGAPDGPDQFPPSRRDPRFQAPTPSPPPIPPVLPDDSAVRALPVRERRRRVVSWAMWDWGSAAFNAVITTFVFTPWLTSAFVDPAVAAAADDAAAGSPAARALAESVDRNSAWLGWGLGAAGLVIALLAPVAGARSDDSGRRKLWLGVHTGIVVLLSAAMFFVRPDPDTMTEHLLLGIFLLSAGNIFFELASVNYNATLAQVSTRENVGRVSGIGWGAGYIGGIILLGLLLAAFLLPGGGLLGVGTEDGLNIRLSMLVAAVWFAVFAIPVLVVVPENETSPARPRTSFFGAYRRLFADIADLWHHARDTLRFLIASAVYRDGLAGVFTFGAVIAAGTFGFTSSEVIYFAIGANLVAGAATIASGWLDDRFGPKAVVMGSLIGLLATGAALFVLHASGKLAFAVLGLLLSAFVGPAQTASRTLLARTIPPGRESEIFGLYATTGRAASFMAPLAFSVMITIGGAQYWGIVGIVAVLGVGLALLVPVKLGRRPVTPGP